MRLTGIVILSIAIVIALSSQAEACSVPVFRYALERWAADPYDVLVFYDGELSPENRSALEFLENSSKAVIPYSNYTVDVFDIAGEMPELVRDILKTIDKPEFPVMAVFYPGFLRMKIPVWTGTLSMKSAGLLVDSPLRQEIAGRILEGESAVWVLLESGNRKLDDSAAAKLEAELKEAEEKMELPYLDNSAPDYVPVDESGPDLRLSFSMVRLSPEDQAESMFVQMLLRTEPDLADYTSHPMAFPVYGRGRVLFALVGDGIDKRNIIEACSFIIGPCSCQIKELNPGIDLLIKADWETGFDGVTMQYIELPPLVGLSELVSDAAASDSGSASNEESMEGMRDDAETSQLDEPEGTVNAELSGQPEASLTAGNISEPSSGGHLYRNILIVLGLIAAVAVFSSFRLIMSAKKRSG